jgi:hypothetical protein
VRLTPRRSAKPPAPVDAGLPVGPGATWPGRRGAPPLGDDPDVGPHGFEALVPDADPEAVDRLVLRWRFAAAGRRPQDYIARDLLFGSLGRDYRATLFHRMRKSPPDWITAAAREAAGRDGRWEVTQPLVDHLVLRRLHGRHLAQLLTVGRGSLEQAGHDTVNALYACRPTGFLMAWHEADGRPHRFVCWRNRACPWCHARKVVDLYGRLAAGPCDPARAGDSLLVMAKVRVDDPPAKGDDPEVLTRDRVDAVHETWRRRLVEFARRRLGVHSGLVGHQVGPVLLAGGDETEAVRSFRHELSVLGAVDCAADGAWSNARHERFQRAAGLGPFLRDWPRLAGAGAGPPLPVEVTAMRMDDPTALRWLLAGSPAQSRWGHSAVKLVDRNRAARGYDGRPALRKALGLDGALALQPTFLFTAAQLWSHLGATAGRHLYSTFGDWSGVDSECGPGRDRGNPALEVLNAARRAEAEGQLAELVGPARAVFEALAAARGRPPGRAVFARGMADAGFEVTDRQARALLTALDPVSPVGARGGAAGPPLDAEP